MLTPTIILPLPSPLCIPPSTSLIKLTLTPHLRHISTPFTGCSNAYSSSINSRAFRCIGAARVDIVVAEYINGTQHGQIFAHAGDFVLVHLPPVRAGEGGGDEGEEGDEAEEDAKAAAEHCGGGFWYCLVAFDVLIFCRDLKKRGRIRVGLVR